MQSSDIPVKFQIPWASQATSPYISQPVPLAPPAAGRTSQQLGFPAPTFEPSSSGGNPPWGADMNGVLNQITAWIRWVEAGGAPVVYDSAFSAAVGGYPSGAMLRSATVSDTTGAQFWVSTADNNTNDPDSNSTGWIAFPSRNVQLQKPNYAADTGAINALAVTLAPAPTSWAQIVGAPVRVKVANANTVTNPTININGLGAKTMINSDGTALAVGQLVAGCILEGFPRDDNKFQVNTPSKASAPGSVFPIPGLLIAWPTDSVPSGFLECNGATLLIASFPNLYAVLGTRYGGDGVNTFRLPDYRGILWRGWNHGKSAVSAPFYDPNAAQRLNSGGGYTGDNVGTLQSFAAGPISIVGGAITINNPRAKEALRPEAVIANTEVSGFFGDWYELPYIGGPLPDRVYQPMSYITGSCTFSGTSGAPETRPVNAYVMFCIAY